MALTPQESRLLGTIDANVKALLERDADKEKRLRSVEKKQWAHSGAVTMLALFLAPILSTLGIKLPGH